MSLVQFQGGFSESSLMAAPSFMMEPLKFYDVSHAAEQQTICLFTTSTQMLPLLRDLSQLSRCRCAVKEPVSEKWCQKLIIKGLEPLSYKLRLRDLGLLNMKKQKILKLIQIQKKRKPKTLQQIQTSNFHRKLLQHREPSWTRWPPEALSSVKHSGILSSGCFWGKESAYHKIQKCDQS